jgi:preprotein translocase SecE subunit
VALIESLKGFFAEAKMEFKKISWPTRDEIKGSTGVVCTAIFFFMVVLGIYDLGIMGVVNVAQRLFSK